MARGEQGIALRHLNTRFSMGADGGLTDTQLLERFSTRRDYAAESAFEILVERHGPMVLRVCRGVLRDPHDAQDAFQATFLVLVQKARSIWVRDSLAPWLHQVAYRTASCARSAAARRQRHEWRAAELTPRAAHSGDHDDLGGAVHDEVGRLPERYRAAVVLCLLEGLTPEQAARHLGCPVGTVHSRLARGRERLRGRLARRGVAVPVGVLSTILGPASTQAAVSTELLRMTVSTAVRVAATRSITTGMVSAQVAALIEGELSMMVLAKLKLVAVTVLVALVGISAAGIRGATVLQSSASANESQSEGASPPAKLAPVANQKSMEDWWTDLEKDEQEASRALLKLADWPNDTVAFLKKKLKPLTLDRDRLKGLLIKLGSINEKEWQPAFEELEYFDPRLAVDLKTLMTDVVDSPTRQRMVAVMSGSPAKSLEGREISLMRIADGDFNFRSIPGGTTWAEHEVSRINNWHYPNKKWKWTRAVRAIAILEHVGTQDAIAVLKEMASGHPLAQPTRAAAEALERLSDKAR